MGGQPGEIFDTRGVPIYPGDLIRSYHYTDRRRKVHYLYHVAVYRWEQLWIDPVNWLEPSVEHDGGSVQLSQSLMDNCDGRVIHGNGPGDYLSYEDRPKTKRVMMMKEDD